MKLYDKIIIGAGLYGLYGALFCAKRGERVLVLEWDDQAFGRATYVNQARVHMGYHYPRSLSTALKSAGYFERFVQDYGFCILQDFEQVYATSAHFSWTDARQFQRFCQAAGIRCEEVNPQRYFRPGMCDGAFLTREYTYDARLLRDYFLEKLKEYPQVEICYEARIQRICQDGRDYVVEAAGRRPARTGFLLNATYASTNQLLGMVEGQAFEPFSIKYELCEIILCEPSRELGPVGITVMDGPFFSIMPFGKTGYHSLTSVTFTPHVTSYESLPTFACQKKRGGGCSPQQLGNCNMCPSRPDSAWPFMSHMAEKYLREEYGFTYSHSLFSMKPILKNSEVDDSRPTVVRKLSQKPTFVSVLSGKINTVYDLDEVFMHE
ncbi:MAG: FAD-binding oxidoreductase [Lachnospiraceae bacterium]|nr:FAD-binding oxidoreductase [Lachnospiraceae bacterium]